MLKIRERLSFVYCLVFIFSLSNRMYSSCLRLINVDIIVFFPILTLQISTLGQYVLMARQWQSPLFSLHFFSSILFFMFFWLPNFLKIHFESDWTDVSSLLFDAIVVIVDFIFFSVISLYRCQFPLPLVSSLPFFIFFFFSF